MPCVYDSLESSLSNANKKVAELTVLLCDAIRDREDRELSSDLLKWRNKHEKSESDRIRIEAIAKLTAQERRVLGL